MIKEIELVWKKRKAVPPEGEVIHSPDQLYEVCKDLSSSVTEIFKAVYMNSRHLIIAYKVVGVGSPNQCSPYISEILRNALFLGASTFAVAHNHPSDSLRPSEEDLDFTRNLKKAGELFNIKLMDHLIITEKEYYSWADHQLL